MKSIKKKRILIFSLMSFIFLNISLIAVASAAPDVTQIKTDIINFFKPVLASILGDSNLTGDQFFAKVLFVVIILAIVWSILDRVSFFAENTWVVAIVSIAFSILSIRFLEADFINMILLPYSTAGIAITALIPLIIYFYFVEQAITSSTFRKIAWIFAGVIFIGLYFTRLPDLKTAGWIYPIVSVLCVGFLFFDKTIQRLWKKAQAESTGELRKSQTRTVLLEKRRRLEEARLNGLGDSDYNTQDKHLKDLERKYDIR
jgi:hypothetical protein